MVTIAHRMRKLKQLLNIRLGPGAAVLPRNVTRLHMDFAYHIEGGYRGPRKFWREMLPRLKYHNPSVDMTVNRMHDQTIPAILSIYRQKAGASQHDDSGSGSGSSEMAAKDGDVERPQVTEFRPVERGEQFVKYKVDKGPPKPRVFEEVVTLDMKNKSQDEILEEFLAMTGAKTVEPTIGELETMQELKEQTTRSSKDRDRSLAVRAAVKREEQILKEARGELDSV